MTRSAADYTNELLNDDCSGVPDNWTNVNTATHTFAGGVMTVTDNGGSSEYIYKAKATDHEFYIEAKFKYTSWTSTPVVMQVWAAADAMLIGCLVNATTKSLYAWDGGGWADTGKDLVLNTEYVLKMWCDSTDGHWMLDLDGTEYGLYHVGTNNVPAKFLIGGGTSAALWVQVYDYVLIKDTLKTGTNCQVNIGDAWKPVSAMQINIGDVWKPVAGMKINIGDAWKTIF